MLFDEATFRAPHNFMYEPKSIITLKYGRLELFKSIQQLVDWNKHRAAAETILEVGDWVIFREDNGGATAREGETNEWWARVTTSHGDMYCPGLLLSGNPVTGKEK